MTTISHLQTTKPFTCPRLQHFLTIAWITLGAFFVASTLQAASPHAGSYSGPVYFRTSGAYSLPEQAVGFILLTVDAEGAITDLSGDLTGTVDDAGSITWNVPNSLHFTTGEIVDNVILSAGSSFEGQVTVHTRIDASSAVAEPFESLAGRVTQLNPTQSLTRMNRVLHANNRFMAVGDRGAVAFSDDGLNWNRFGLNTSLTLHNIAFGNGIYIAVGETHSRFRSTDGDNWTALPKPLFALAIRGIAFGNGTFVIADTLGSVQTSADGLAWNDVGSPLPGSGYPNVDYINERFVLTRDSRVSYSDDGQTWTDPITHPAGNSSGTPQLFAYGNGRYVVGGFSGLAYSTDGVDWTKTEIAATGISFVVFGMDAFYARDVNKVLWRSEDGIDWVPIQVFNPVSSQISMAFSDSIGVCVGPHLYTSTDGFAWNHSENDSTAPNIRNYNVSGRTGSNVSSVYQTDFSAGRYFANANLGTVGPQGVRAGNGLFHSPATYGTFWLGDRGFIHILQNGVQSQPTPVTDRNLHTAIENSSGFVIAGDGGVMIRVTTPPALGDSHGLEVLPAITEADLLWSTAMFANPHSRIIVGSGGTILRSTDSTLREWSVIGSGNGRTLRHVASYSQLDYLLVAVGDNGTIVTSTDGSGWTVRESDTSVNLVGSAFDSGHILAAGEDGTLVVSEDGITWKRAGRLPTSQRLSLLRSSEHNSFPQPQAVGVRGVVVTPSLTGYNGSIGASHTVSTLPSIVAPFNGVAYGNGRFVLVGHSGSAVSSDGIDWQARPSPITFEHVTFGNGRFVGVGQSGKVATSNNGLHWQAHDGAPFTRTFLTAAFGGGRFAAAGEGSPTFVMTSTDGVEWTEHVLAGNRTMNSMTYQNGTFVGVGAGFVRSTDNGQSWTTGAISGGPYNGVAYGNGRFVAAGNSGWIANSTDGSSWTSQQLPILIPGESRPEFDSVSFVNNEFMITTEGAIYRSDTGVAGSWSRLPSGIPIATPATIVAGGRYIMAGANQVHSISAPDPGSPVIVGQPLDQSVAEGGTLELTAKAIGGESLEYQWFYEGELLQNGGSISGADSSTLTIENLSSTSAGAYQFVATNPNGSRASRQAMVAVTDGGTSTFEDWIAQYDVPPGLDGPDADANGDGISNKIDFALGGNPTIPHSAQLPTAVEAVVDDVIYPALQFTRNRNATGIEIQVSGSTTLTSNESPELVETLEDLGYGVDRVTIRSTTPLPNITTFFFEVRLTTQ